MSMNWFLIKQALQRWAATYSGITVIWQSPDVPQPSRPFIVLDMGAITKPCKDQTTAPNESGHRIIYGTREFTVSIKYLGSWNASGQLDDLLTTLERVDVRARLAQKGVIILETGPVHDTSFLESSHNVDRADAEIFCRTAVNMPYGGDSPETSIIEQVTIVGNYQPVNKDQTIIVP